MAVCQASAPPLSVTWSVTTYVPADANACVAVLDEDEPPSPKLHERVEMLPSASALTSVNVQLRPLQVYRRLAVGGSFDPPGGETCRLTECVRPSSSVTVSLTVRFPPLAYVWEGEGRVELVPSPNSHFQATTSPSGSVLVLPNSHTPAEHSNAKPATGGWSTGGGPPPMNDVLSSRFGVPLLVLAVCRSILLRLAFERSAFATCAGVCVGFASR